MKNIPSLTFLLFSVLSLATPAYGFNPEHLERLLKTNQCPNCDLSNADLEDANLFGANLNNANLTDANLQGANLGFANLIDANLTGANLSNAYLYQVIAKNANFKNSSLVNADLQEAHLPNINFRDANLEGIDLSYTYLVGVDLRGINLKNANLSHSILTGFQSGGLSRGAEIIFSFTLNSDPLYCEAFQVENISNYRDPKYSFTTANLEGTNLENAKLRQTMMVGANLENTNLRNADLTGACLSGAQFHQAILEGAIFKDAILNGVTLDRASLNNAIDADIQQAYQRQIERTSAARQSIARNNVGAMNRGQQAYHLETTKFSAELEKLGIGLSPETEYYTYRIVATDDRRVINFARAKQPELKSYLGAVFVVQLESGEHTTYAQVCESDRPTSTRPATLPEFIADTGEVRCPSGFHTLGG